MFWIFKYKIKNLLEKRELNCLTWITTPWYVQNSIFFFIKKEDTNHPCQYAFFFFFFCFQDWKLTIGVRFAEAKFITRNRAADLHTILKKEFFDQWKAHWNNQIEYEEQYSENNWFFLSLSISVLLKARCFF